MCKFWTCKVYHFLFKTSSGWTGTHLWGSSLQRRIGPFMRGPLIGHHTTLIFPSSTKPSRPGKANLLAKPGTPSRQGQCLKLRFGKGGVRLGRCYNRPEGKKIIILDICSTYCAPTWDIAKDLDGVTTLPRESELGNRSLCTRFSSFTL